MEEFLRSYGIWIVIAAAFIGVHWLGGMRCGGAHRHGRHEDEPGESNAKGTADAAPRRGCH